MTNPIYIYHLTTGDRDIAVKSFIANGGAQFNSGVSFNGTTEFEKAKFTGAATFTSSINFGTGVAGKFLRNTDGAGSLGYSWPGGNYATKTDTDYTITDSDGLEAILVSTGSSDRTITLPTAADNDGRVLTIKKIDSGSGKVIVDGEGSETIDGVTSIKMATQYDNMKIISDGSDWYSLELNVVFSARYYASSSTSNSSFADNSGERVDFDTKVHDTQDAVTTGSSWVFTAKIAGYYRTYAQILWANANNLFVSYMYIYYNGSNICWDQMSPGSSENNSMRASATRWLNAGETIFVILYQDDTGGSARSIYTPGEHPCNISISLVK